jgi:hypothetical protein
MTKAGSEHYLLRTVGICANATIISSDLRRRVARICNRLEVDRRTTGVV